jgi:hypothetical protein
MFFMGGAIAGLAKKNLKSNGLVQRLTGIGLKKKHKKSLIKKDETKAIKKPVQQKKIKSVSLK